MTKTLTSQPRTAASYEREGHPGHQGGNSSIREHNRAVVGRGLQYPMESGTTAPSPHMSPHTHTHTAVLHALGRGGRGHRLEVNRNSVAPRFAFRALCFALRS